MMDMVWLVLVLVSPVVAWTHPLTMDLEYDVVAVITNSVVVCSTVDGCRLGLFASEANGNVIHL
jgi:hypothetical protein